jgi:hypothetical protein
MKQIQTFSLLAALILTAVAFQQITMSAAAATSAPQAQSSQQPPTIASVVDRDISAIEKQVVDAAEAMPEDKFNFSPENLNIPGSHLQLLHLVAANQRKTPRRLKRRKRARELEDQSGHHQVPQRLLRAWASLRSHFDC